MEIPSVRHTRQSQEDAETPSKSFLFTTSTIPDAGVKNRPNALYDSDYLANPLQNELIGIAAFKTYLSLLKSNHKGFEIRLKHNGNKHTQNLLLDENYALRDLKTPNFVIASGLDKIYQFLAEENNDGFNVFAIINDINIKKLLADVRRSGRYKTRQKIDKRTGKPQFKKNRQWKTEDYDPRTNKTVNKVKGTNDTHINGYPFAVVDIDNKPEDTLSNLELLMAAPITPYLIVQSSYDYKLQAYYKIDGIKSGAKFKRLQTSLALKFNSDVTVSNRSRLFRVAGFNNVKSDLPAPMPSKIVYVDESQQISLDDFVQAMDLDISPSEKRSKTRKKSSKVITSKNKSNTSAPDTNSTYKDIPHHIVLKLSKAKTLQQFKDLFVEVYPAPDTFRHYLCLYGVGEMLLRFKAEFNDCYQFIEDTAELKGDTEIDDRQLTVETTFKRFDAGLPIRGIRSKSSFRIWQQCFYTSLLKIDKTLRSEMAYRRVLTTIYYNQLSDGVCGAFSIRQASVLSGVGKDKTNEIFKELQEQNILLKTGKCKHTSSSIFVFVLPRNIDALLLPIETLEDASSDDLKRLQKKIDLFNKQRNKYEAKIQSYNASYQSPITKVQTEGIDTVTIDVTREAPAFAAPSDDSQTNVKPTSEVAAHALIVADGDYAPKPLDVAEDYAEGSAPLANAPP